MKKPAAIILALALALMLAACNGSDGETTADSASPPPISVGDSSQAGDAHSPGNEAEAEAEAYQGYYVVAAGRGQRENLAEIAEWRDVVAIDVAGEGGAFAGDSDNGTVVGLKADGTVVVAGARKSQPDAFSEWQGIAQVAIGSDLVVGLKADGTVEVTNPDFDVSDWRDIAAVDAGKNRPYVYGLKSDGTVVVGYSSSRASDENYSGLHDDVSSWSGIVAISAGFDRLYGLKADGTVLESNEYPTYGVSDWSDIVAIDADVFNVAGLKADGTVVVAGNTSDGQDGVSSWSDIVAVTTGHNFILGLKSDGAIVAAGENSQGQLAIATYRDVVAIAAGRYSAAALTSTNPEEVAIAPPAAAPEVAFITIRGEQYSTGLTELWLNDGALTNEDIEPLRHMTNLTSLSIGSPAISDLSPLSGLVNLMELNVRWSIWDASWRETNPPPELDLAPLANLKMLKTLDLRGFIIHDLSPLSGLANLENLILQWNVDVAEQTNYWGPIRDISPLASLKNLKALDLWLQTVNDLSPLAELTELVFLNLNTALLDADDLSALAALYKLEYLDLGNVLGFGNEQVRDISPLAGLASLRYLDLSGNYMIGDISALSGLANLEVLGLSECGISDISALAGLPNLQEVTLSNWSEWPMLPQRPWYGSNQITDWSPVAHVPNVGGRL